MSKINDPQANAERVLREGEKQEPVYWSVTYCGQHTGNVKRSPEQAQALVDRLDKDYKDEAGLRAVVPLYTHPAPSLQAFGSVAIDLSKLDTYSWGYGGMGKDGRASDKFPSDFVLLSDLKDLIAAPQPPAAPSGDVEQKDARSLMPRPCNHCNCGKVKSSLTMMEQPCYICAGSGMIWPNAEIIAAITATKE